MVHGVVYAIKHFWFICDILWHYTNMFWLTDQLKNVNFLQNRHCPLTAPWP